MKKIIFTHSLLVLFFLLDNVSVGEVSGSETAAEPVAKETWQAAPASTYSGMSLELSTPTHKVIEFDAMEPEEKPAQEVQEIPHLVLKRNGVLTPGYERTLEISANNIPVYAPGIFVALTISTQHIDPDHEKKEGKKIHVWRGHRFVTYNALTQQGVKINFSVTFDNYTKLDNETIHTPTDYFQYQISIIDLNGNLRQSHTENYAFLMENQWRVPLPQLLETEPGAAPDHLLVYYYDMIPFQADMRDPTSQVPRQDVERYIQVELVPAMVQAIQTQSNDWGFVWYPEWRNFRRDEDPKTLSVALGEHGIWYHGESPSLGHSMISIRVDGTAGEYDNLTDGIMSIFHHELFHNLQRNINLHYSGNGNVAGLNETWKTFSEGTAVLASSVGQPRVQFEQTSASRSYMKRANAFIGADGIFGGGLNKSYEQIPYHTATYWRFLYEKCGGVNEGIEDPATGMGVIRIVLETLYKGEVVDIHSSADVIESLPLVMDEALTQSPSCPFVDYEESLSEFAHAIYMLRLEDGRCEMQVKNGCGFYDPNSLYNTPPAEKVSVTERPATYINGNIPSSYGIDFVEMDLDSMTDGRVLTITFARSSVSKAEFKVEMVILRSQESYPGANIKPEMIGESKVLDGENGHLAFDLERINLNEFDRLALVITRMDPNEKLDKKGSYNVQISVR